MSRDTSADTTLDNANMGMREKFEKWWVPWGDMHLDKLGMKRMALDSWQSRQPEIDALKEERDHAYSLLRGRTPAQCDLLSLEIAALNAENERLRKDAERYRWLRDPCVDIRPIIKYQRGDYGWGLWTHKALDEAIDAAMKDFSTTRKEERRGSEET